LLRACSFVVAGFLSVVHAQSSGMIVRFDTHAGPIDIQLYDHTAPRTVGNFLSYVQSGAYDGTFFHRLVRGFVLQGGGLRWSDGSIPHVTQMPVSSPVANEFSSDRSNLRGTVAMAKIEGNPDSATSQWFVNLADNSANLDNQNGGFTVFGKVLSPGMVVVDGLAQLTPVNATACTNLGGLVSVMSAVPMPVRPPNCESVSSANLARASSVRVLPGRHVVAPTERVFDYLEAAYPQHLAPASPATQQGNGFVYRYYAKTQAYLGILNGDLYAVLPTAGATPIPLGTLATWLDISVANGY
jgi:cyclophilin family peptidyl-prolyl cis-trans isomerase